MRSVVSVGLVGGVAGAIGLFSLMILPRHAITSGVVDIRAALDAELARGEQLWRASCPVEGPDGACLARAPARERTPGALPTTCSPGSGRRWTVIPRGPAMQAAALAAFGHVADALQDAVATHPGFRHELALARLYEGDALREAALAIAVPSDALDLRGWLEARTAARDRAAATYAEVLARRDRPTAIAAAARTAQLTEDLADQLFTVEIPGELRAGEDAADKVDAFCDATTAAAEPLLQTAIDGYVACLAKATELDWYGPWFAVCETALERLDPTRYPMMSERRRTPELDGSPDASPDAALRGFAQAIADDPSQLMPWIDAGLVSLQLRRYAVAERLFGKALELAPMNYDALIGLGIAQRGRGDLDAAEASYESALATAPERGEAYYDLGVLYKDFRANAQSDDDPTVALRRSEGMTNRARAWFTRYLDHADRAADRDDAQTQIAQCDALRRQIEAFILAK